MNVSDPHIGASASHPSDMPLPPLPTNSTQNIESARARTQSISGRQSLNGNGITTKNQRNVSDGEYPGQEIFPEVAPDRDSSTRRKPLPVTRNGASSAVSSSKASNREDVTHPKGPRTPPGHKATRSIDIAPNEPSRLVPHFTTRSPVEDNRGGAEPHHRDLRVPASFDLSNTERTIVDTNIVPAVTQENIHVQRTEIVTKAIHRDIHVDHHYTYVQPIPILEVLPARHFRLDPITGVKTEISAPPGYKLPAHLEPHKAEDYSHLRKTTRHYVVDENHPQGLLESAPLKNGNDVSSFGRDHTD